MLDRLHGAVRYLSQTARRVDPGEAEESLEVAGVPVRKGSRVLRGPGGVARMRRTSSWPDAPPWSSR